MKEIIREAALGQIIRLVSGNRFLRYPEEEPGFEPVFENASPLEPTTEKAPGSQTPSVSSEKEEAQREHQQSSRPPSLAAVQTQRDHDAEANGPMGIEKTLSSQGKIVVTWYGPHDPANPQNWSINKKNYITFLIW